MKEKFNKLFTKDFWRSFFVSFVWLGILLFIIDIVSKQIVKNLMTVGQYIELIPNFLAIHYIQNSGMAFGIKFGDALTNTIVFCLISILGFILLLGVYLKTYKKSTKVMRASLILMITGCFGNLIDRCFYYTENGTHYVVDFIGFFGPEGFARFNVADACLVIGCIMLAVYFIVSEFKETKKARKVEIVETKNGTFKADENAQAIEETPIENTPVSEEKTSEEVIENPKPVEENTDLKNEE